MTESAALETSTAAGRIVSIAEANLGKGPCSTNSAGGKGYYTSCTGAGGVPEAWCADFAHWVWAQAGVITDGLTAAAGSFGLYGELQSTPHVGDAVVFNYNGQGYADHVALVIQVNSDGTVVSIGGDEGPGPVASNLVQKDGPYSDAIGPSSYWGMSISGYVTPRGGGILASSTSTSPVVAWAANRLDAFAVGSDHAVHHQAWDGKWTGWGNLGGAVDTAYAAPAVASWAANRLDAFVVGTNQAVYHNAWDGKAWTGWGDRGGTAISSPAVVSWGANRLDVFVVGTNHALYHQAWTGTKWTAWESLGGSVSPAYPTPAVAAWGPNRLDVFVVGTNQAVYHKAWNGKAWASNWDDLGGTAISGPQVASWGPNRLDVFVVGTNKAVYHKAWNGKAWASGWGSLGGTIATF